MLDAIGIEQQITVRMWGASFVADNRDDKTRLAEQGRVMQGLDKGVPVGDCFSTSLSVMVGDADTAHEFAYGVTLSSGQTRLLRDHTAMLAELGMVGVCWYSIKPKADGDQVIQSVIDNQVEETAYRVIASIAEQEDLPSSDLVFGIFRLRGAYIKIPLIFKLRLIAPDGKVLLHVAESLNLVWYGA